MAEAQTTRQRLLLTLVLIGLGALMAWFAGFAPYFGAREDSRRKRIEAEEAIAAETRIQALIKARRLELKAIDGRALHLEPAEADQHCQQLLYKWAAAGNLQGPLVRTLRPSRLAGPRSQRAYSLTGTATLEGVRGMLYALRTDPIDRDIRRMRRLDMAPAGVRSPEQLRVTLNVDWLVSADAGTPPTTRPAPPTEPITQFDALVERGMFIPYSPPQRIVITPPAPEPEQPGDPPRQHEPRKERWQLSLVANAGTGLEAEFISEHHGRLKLVHVGDRFAGYGVHAIDLTAKTVIFRQGNLLFEVALGSFFEQRKVVGKLDGSDRDADAGKRNRRKKDRR